MLGLMSSQFNRIYSLMANPSTTPGVSVTPGSGSKGSYVALCSAANNPNGYYGVLLWVHAGNTSATIRDILLDIGTDPAGGTSYSQVNGINNIFVPQASSAVNSGRWFYFPIFIPAGYSVGARGQANSTSTFRVGAIFFGNPSHPELVRAGQYSETLGVSGNGGTPLTMGSSGAEAASWTLLGTTTRPCWWWQLAAGHNVGTTTAQMYFFDLAYGDGTNMVTIIQNLPQFNPGTAEISGNPLWPCGFCEVPAGASIYARGSASGTAETCEAVAVGIGG
jgi:hypothetical protein